MTMFFIACKSCIHLIPYPTASFLTNHVLSTSDAQGLQQLTSSMTITASSAVAFKGLCEALISRIQRLSDGCDCFDFSQI